MKHSIFLLSLFVLMSALFSCGNSKKTNYPNGYEPTEVTLQILDELKENKLDREPQEIVFPRVTSGLLLKGLNTAGKDFANHTVNVLENPSADIYHELSVNHLKNGNYSESFRYMSKAVEKDPKEYAGYFGWTLLYYYRDYQKALEYLQLYDEFTPNFSDFPSGENINYLYGIAHMQLGNSEKALEEFNTYIDAETAIGAESFIDLAAFVHIGRIYEKLGRTSEAVQAYEKAIEVNQRCVEAFYFLADVEFRTNQVEQAAIHIEKAESLYANFRARDAYVELFHEIYPEQIKSLKELILAESGNE